jgi:hypothetical protein
MNIAFSASLILIFENELFIEAEHYFLEVQFIYFTLLKKREVALS